MGALQAALPAASEATSATIEARRKAAEQTAAAPAATSIGQAATHRDAVPVRKDERYDRSIVPVTG